MCCVSTSSSVIKVKKKKQHTVLLVVQIRALCKSPEFLRGSPVDTGRVSRAHGTQEGMYEPNLRLQEALVPGLG